MDIPMVNNDFCQVVLDSITAHVAILDENGVIVSTNRAWQEYASINGLVSPNDCIGQNYLKICDTTPDSPDKEIAKEVANGIRKVLSGKIDEFFTHYPCHTEEQQSWYAVRVVPFRDVSEKMVIVTHENIMNVIMINIISYKLQISIFKSDLISF